MAKNRGTQLTSSKGRLNVKDDIVGTWGEPTLWAAPGLDCRVQWQEQGIPL